MTPDAILPIVLIVLVVVGIWAVVEVALTMRSTRRDVERLTTAAREVVEQAQPVVAKLDGIMDELEPAAKRVTPLIEKTEAAVGEASTSLDRLNGILDDVSSVSSTASSVTGAVKGVAESAASAAAGVVSRLRGETGPEAAALLDAQPPASLAGTAETEAAPARYVDYSEVAPAASPVDAAEKNEEAE